MSSNPKKASFEPEIVVLYCQHCVNSDSDIRAEFKPASGFSVRHLEMPCSSKVELPHLLKILEQGADGVEVVTCPKGKCRMLVGNLRAQKRIEYARRLLEQIDIGADRLGLSRGSGLSAKELISLAQRRAEATKLLGSNPMKKGNDK